MTMSTKGEFTTVSLRRETKSRLAELMPYESLSWDEWLTELADDYQEKGR